MGGDRNLAASAHPFQESAFGQDTLHRGNVVELLADLLELRIKLANFEAERVSQRSLGVRLPSREPPGFHIVSSDLNTLVSQAKQKLDEQTVDVVQLHFHPELGAPYWLELAQIQDDSPT